MGEDKTMRTRTACMLLAGATGKILKVAVEVKPVGEADQAAALRASAETAGKLEAAK